MIIDFEMLKRFNRTIDDILFKELALGADNAHIRCKVFLDEAPEVINRRNDLSGKLVKLEAARLELQKVGNAVSKGVYLDLTACQALASSGIDPNTIEIVRPESSMAPMAPYGATVYECQELAPSDIESDANELVRRGSVRSEASMDSYGDTVH